MIHLIRRVGLHAQTIRRDIFKEPLNRGRKLRLLRDYFRWHLLHKYRGKRWLFTLQNGSRSWVYPFPDHDPGEANIWNTNVDYHDNAFIRSHLKSGEFIVDAGCNVGNRTWVLSDIIGGALMIDAGAAAIARCRENIKLNNLSEGDFVLLEKAVGESEGTVYFSDAGGASTINRIVSSSNHGSAIPVEMTTIDRELEDLGKAPAFIKVDVEGHDLQALRGAVRTLKSGSVRLVKFEHNQTEPIEPLLDLFASLRWKVFALDKLGRPTLDRTVIETNVNLFACPHSAPLA